MSYPSLVESEWLRAVCDRQLIAAELLARSVEEQRRLGYFNTLREICQQPATWLKTRDQMLGHSVLLESSLSGIASLVLTGSGSSEYVGDCVRFPLETELGISTQVVAGGAVLAHGRDALAPSSPALMVSIARSGDSPESAGALALLLRTDSEIRHLVVTCNATGTLARTYQGDPRVAVITLDPATNDQGLVMTSSFTNLALSVRFLGMLPRPETYSSICTQLSQIASAFIQDHFGTLASIGKMNFRRALFLGSGARFGAAREAALKMLEMTAGRVTTMAETYLGLRHGPMSYVHNDALVVCFLSSDPGVRAYEVDLIRELNRKELGLVKLIVGEKITTDLLRGNDVALECPGLADLGDDNAPLIDVLAGQILGFFRCMEEKLRPDSPSEDGVISRVVQTFALHIPNE